MRVNVKLHGLLSKGIQDYRDSTGMEMELPEGAKTGDLLSLLKIEAADRSIVVTMNSKIMKPDEEIIENSQIQVLQLVRGG